MDKSAKSQTNKPKTAKVYIPKSPREAAVIKHSQALADDAKENAKHIHYISFGSDKNKIRKNSEACDRGSSSGPARYCSAHLRPIYPQKIIGDNNKTEWCVEGRHNKQCCKSKSNSCRLCNIDTNNYIKLPMTKFAEALREELGVTIKRNKGKERYNRALQSFLTSHIISDYPGTKKENTILRIKRNGKVWMEYFIKLTAFSSLLKTSAPSGYKYKDRISIGGKIKIQNNIERDLIFCIEKDESYNDPEKEQERPVVNGVGFWNLLKEPKQDEIRNIIQLNIDQAVNVCFGFYIKNDHNVQKLEVELECTRHGLGLNEKPITLWSWPSNNDDVNSMSSIDIDEQKSNSNGSPTISTQSLPSARSISPMSRYDNHPSFDPSFDPLNTIPTIPSNSMTMPVMPPLPPQIRHIPQMSQLPHNAPPQIMPPTIPHHYDYNNINHYQQQSAINDVDYITHYGGYHAAHYVNHRHNPYYRPSNNNNSQINLINFEAQNNNQHDIMEQDEFMGDDQGRFIDNNNVSSNTDFLQLPFPDNETIFTINGLNHNDNHPYFDNASMS